MNSAFRHISIFCFIALLGMNTSGYGQEVDFEPEDSVILKRYLHLSAGTGMMNYFGELDNDINLPVSRRLGTRFLFNYSLSPSLTVGIGLITGRLFGQLRSDSTDLVFTNLNFMTTLFAQQMRFTYNFGGWHKGMRPGVVQPYVFAGVASLFYKPYGDNTTSTGEPYYYWKDGSIRDMPEEPENFYQASYIQRDYVYETILPSANLDGFGQYLPFTLSIPFGAGIDFNLNKNITLTVEASYDYTFTDHLDDITYKSGATDPSRAIGNRINDGYLAIQAGLTYKWYDLRKVGTKITVPPPAVVRMPVDFIPFDLNNNGIIDREEVINAINDLFNEAGNNDPELIGLLVDYYNIQETTKEKINY